MRTCPDCHSLVDDEAVFCDNCGFKLPPVEREIEPTIKAEIPPASRPAFEPAAQSQPAGTCSVCGYVNMPGEMFCQNCGVQLAPVASTPPAPPVPVEQSKSQPDASPISPPQAPAAAPASKPTAPEEIPAASIARADGECSNCGFQNVADEKYCQNCGQQLIVVMPVLPATAPEITLEEESEPEGEVTFTEEPLPAVQAELPAVEEEGEISQVQSALVEEPPILEPARELPEQMEAITAEDSLSSFVPAEVPAAQVPAEFEAEPVEPQPIMPVIPSVPISSQPIVPAATWITGKLVVRTSGVEIPLPSGHNEITIGRVDLVRNIFPDIDLSGFGGESSGVSRMHARLVLRGNQLYIEDLNSTNYTFVNRLRLQPGQPYLVSDGDEIRLGLLALVFRTS